MCSRIEMQTHDCNPDVRALRAFLSCSTAGLLILTDCLFRSVLEQINDDDDDDPSFDLWAAFLGVVDTLKNT